MTILAFLCAGGVLALLLAARQPAEGWNGWLRSSLAAWRGDKLGLWQTEDDSADVGDLADLYALSEPVAGSAYTSAAELRQTLAAVGLRLPVRG